LTVHGDSRSFVVGLVDLGNFDLGDLLGGNNDQRGDQKGQQKTERSLHPIHTSFLSLVGEKSIQNTP